MSEAIAIEPNAAAEEPPFVPCEFYMTWTKTGRLPRFTHVSREVAKQEARRLAAKAPGHTFIVLQGVEKVRYGEEDKDGAPHVHPDRLLIGELIEALKRARNICEDAYKDTAMSWDEEAMASFDAAIAKAEGRLT